MACIMRDCGKTAYNNKQVQFFRLPTLPALRAKWLAACECDPAELPKAAAVCSLHFSADDIYLKGKRLRLHRNVLPKRHFQQRCPFAYSSVDPGGPAEFSSVGSGISSAQINETLSEEQYFVPIYKQSKNSNTETKDTPTNLQQHVREHQYFKHDLPIISPEPQEIELINEELFDETLHDANMTNGCTESSQQRRSTCGYIEVSADNKTYTMLCQQCEQEFAIWDWVKFVKHDKDAHRNMQWAAGSADNSEETDIAITNDAHQSDTAMSLPLQKTINKDVLADNKQQREQQNVEEDSQDIVKEKPLAETESVGGDEYLTKQKTADEDVLAENKQQREQQNDEEDWLDNENLNKSCNSVSDSGASNADEEDGVINLKKTKPKIVLDFLALLREHPILVGRRGRLQQQQQEYDAALSVAMEKFNRKWSRSMTAQAMQGSVTVMQRWYRGAVRDKKDYSKNETYQLYFDKCKALFPRYAFDCKKYCEQCQKEFKVPSKYRTHMAMKHGKPKLKCHLCPRTYYFQWKLTNHIKAHKNQRDIVCEVCGMLFVQLRYLKVHARTHDLVERKVEERYRCDMCPKTYSSPGRLSRHKAVIHGLSNARVRGRGKVREEANMSTAANGKPKVRKPYECDLCDGTYTFPNGLRKHKVLVHCLPRKSVHVYEKKAGPNLPS